MPVLVPQCAWTVHLRAYVAGFGTAPGQQTVPHGGGLFSKGFPRVVSVGLDGRGLRGGCLPAAALGQQVLQQADVRCSGAWGVATDAVPAAAISVQTCSVAWG